jgi:hypothetical protein
VSIRRTIGGALVGVAITIAGIGATAAPANAMPKEDCTIMRGIMEADRLQMVNAANPFRQIFWTSVYYQDVEEYNSMGC